MKLYDLTKEDLDRVATRARLMGRMGASLGYLLQIKYGNRRPSPQMARAIEISAADCGFQISRFDLLYPEDRETAPKREEKHR